MSPYNFTLFIFLFISSVFSYPADDFLSRRTPSILLAPISTNAPPSLFTSRPHTQPPQRLDPEFAKLNKPIPTNKFYTNLLVGNGIDPVFPLPYALRFESGKEPALKGFSISNVDDDQKVFGPDSSADPVQFFFSIYTPSITISANELPASPNLLVSDPKDFSIVATLSISDSQKITMPIVRGMAFVTGEYTNMTPLFLSGVGFKSLSAPKLIGSIQQFNVELNDGSTWLIYAIGGKSLELSLNNGQIECSSGPFDGLIQIAKIPKGNTEAEGIYGQSAGIYSTGAVLDVKNDGVTGTYTFNWEVAGDGTKNLLQFALPHHVSSLTSGATKQPISLTTPSKGQAIAYTGTSWTFTESQLNDIGILPKDFKLTDDELRLITEQAVKDVAQDFKSKTNLDTMYFSGKGLAKFALVCLVVNDVIKDTTLAGTCINKLKDAMGSFVQNQQLFPLVYDISWKGIVSSQAFVKNDPFVEFGATFYNDHHFHYGYFVYTAAILRHLDETWGQQNEEWVNALIRDVANPSESDGFFPTFRNFDWFAGHSWASGIFPAVDGNNEESSSEDYNFFYGMKLWGQISKKENIELLANVILAVEARSFQSYYLLKDDNIIQPKNFIKNKVTGILFDNKADCTTFFSNAIEAIHGIQMIPVTPIMPYIRTKEFITEEWNQVLGSIVDGVTNGFQSLLQTNHAIIEPTVAFNHFANNPDAPLDDGLTRTWALFWCAVQE